MRKIAIQLFDEHAVLRDGLRSLIGCQPDMEVTAEADDAATAVTEARTRRPSVVVMEIGPPEGDGIEAIGKIVEAAPDTRVLVLSMHRDAAHVRNALRGGASGYVAKRVSGSEVIDAIRAVANGNAPANVPRNPNPAPEKPVPFDRSPGVEARLKALSPRERDVLRLLLLGYTNKEIATRFNLSVKSVETYRRRVSAKLGASGRADLVRFGIEAGLLEFRADL
jgi:DNA-binding NarL/FixJ family response regulator